MGSWLFSGDSAITRVQATLLLLYRLVSPTRLLATPWGCQLFECAYGVYKERIESGPVSSLRRWIRPNTLVIDVGANIGYFTLRFAAWVGPGGKVLAIEPELRNFQWLQRQIARSRYGRRVEAIQAAAAEVDGAAFLQLDPLHPGNHRLGTQGVPVATVQLDSLLAARSWPDVSFIKIDVQGAEARVLRGARATLQRCRPALLVEVDDRALEQFGSSAGALLKFCTDQGYQLQTFTRSGISAAQTVEQVLSLLRSRDYLDVFLTPSR